MSVWRWRQEPRPGTPEENMAVDAALLRALCDDPDALPTVRAYTWDRPCVSIGRSQEEAAIRAAYPGLPLVRRPTGGRAVRHGNDLTLAVAARLSDLPPQAGTGILATYRLLAAGLMDAFRALDVPAAWGTSLADHPSHGVDCFASAARCDIVHGRTGQKLAGCAQRRAGTVLLQQMSVPLVSVPDQVRFTTLFREHAAIHLGVTAWQDEANV